jgi:hypothetical protein
MTNGARPEPVPLRTGIVSPGKDLFFIAASIVLAIFTFIPVCWILRDPTPARAYIERYAPYFVYGARNLYPEFNERMYYVLGIFYLPGASLLLYLLGRYLDRLRPAWFRFVENGGFPLLRDFIVADLIFVWGYAVFKFGGMDVGMGRFSLYVNPYLFWAAAILFAGWILSWNRIPDAWRAPSRLILPAGILVIGLNSLLLLVPEGLFFSNPFVTHHGGLLLGSVNQVLHGKTVLVDLKSQYGILYPHVVEIVFRVIPLTLLCLSVVFTALSFLSYWFMFLAMRERMGRQSWFAVVGAIVVLVISQPFYECLITEFHTNFPNYAYLPIRMLFGAFFMWFVTVYCRQPRTWKAILGAALCGVAVLWNADTGIVITVAWAAVLGYHSLSRNEWPMMRRIGTGAGHAALIAGGVAAAFCGYSLFALIRTGRFPAWSEMFEFQAVFYKSGYYMLPMRPIDIWHIPALIYFAALVMSGLALLKGKATERDHFNLFVALYGVGAFSYYQGRSHILCLYTPIFPAAILAAVLLHDFIRERRASRLAARALLADSSWRWRTILAMPLILIVTYGLTTFAVSIPDAWKYFREQVAGDAAHRQAAPFMPETIAHIRQNAQSPELLILTEHSELVHFLTGTYSCLPFSSLKEVMLVEHYRLIQRVISAPGTQQIFVIPADYLFRFDYAGYEGRDLKLDGMTVKEWRRRGAF